MLRNPQISNPHKCWFCFQGNPSYCHQCEYCEGAIRPTRDESRKQLEWTILSFGSVDSVSERSPFSHFSNAVEVFDTQDRVAIHLSNDRIKYPLIRHSQHGETLYSMQEKKGEPRTVNWDKADEKDRMSFFRFVDENLHSGERTASESNLLEKKFKIF